MAKKICELSLSPDLGGLELYMMRASRYFRESCVSVINDKGKLGGYYDGSIKPAVIIGLDPIIQLFSWGWMLRSSRSMT